MALTSALGLNSLRPGVCTSATRPAVPYNGQSIYETDTGRVMFHNGTGWVVLSEPAVTWTPTFGGINGGTTLGTGEYHRSDGYMDIFAKLVFNAGATVANPYVLLPFTAAVFGSNRASFAMYDNAGYIYLGMTGGVGSPSTTVNLFSVDASVTRAYAAGVNGTSPFTIGAGDVWEVQGRYRLDVRHSY